MTVLTSVALIFIGAITLGSLCAKIKLPPLLGMLLTGIILGPFVLNLIAPNILAISPDLRQLALLVILLRAGLGLNYKELLKNGAGAVLLCFVPALFELAAYSFLGVFLLKLSLIDSLLLGSVMASVSAAVIVPIALKIKESGYGVKKGIPQMLTACSSVDNAFVIILFTAFLGFASSGAVSFNFLWEIPLSIVLGLALGLAVGLVFVLLFKKIHMRDSVKVVLLLSVAFLMLGFQTLIEQWLTLAALLSVITMGAVVFSLHKDCAKRLSRKFSSVWVMAEILLFSLVGAAADLRFVVEYGLIVLAVIVIALVFRAAGVFICLLKSKLNMKERAFCMIAAVPKAAVQAAIGAIPFSLGLPCGDIILAAAVISIIVTAPLGAIAMNASYKKLLHFDAAEDETCSLENGLGRSDVMCAATLPAEEGCCMNQANTIPKAAEVTLPKEKAREAARNKERDRL